MRIEYHLSNLFKKHYFGNPNEPLDNITIEKEIEVNNAVLSTNELF